MRYETASVYGTLVTTYHTWCYNPEDQNPTLSQHFKWPIAKKYSIQNSYVFLTYSMSQTISFKTTKCEVNNLCSKCAFSWVRNQGHNYMKQMAKQLFPYWIITRILLLLCSVITVPLYLTLCHTLIFTFLLTQPYRNWWTWLTKILLSSFRQIHCLARIYVCLKIKMMMLLSVRECS